MKRIGAAGVLVILVIGWIILSASFYTIDPSEQAIITQFGEPVGEPVREPGLHWKTPFIQVIHRIPRQILEWDGQANEMPTRDKLYISVNTFGRWRITEPLEYYRRLRDERSAQSRLEDVLGSETRNAIAKHDLIEIVRTTRERKPQLDETLEEMTDGTTSSIGVMPPIRKGRTKIEGEIEVAARAKLAEFGIELLDVRFKRVNYNPSVVDKIYERMISERQQIASKFRSEGEGAAARIIGNKERDMIEIQSEAYRKVEEIRGAADAKATEIYAQAYNQGPESVALYRFVKTMNTYREVIGESTTLVLSTDSEFFHFLKDSSGGAPTSAPAPAAPPAPFDPNMVEVTLTYDGGLHCRAVHGPSQKPLETDAPVDNMGRGESFSPTDLVGTALGTCMVTTMAIVAQRHGVELKGSSVRVEKHMTSEPPRRIARLVVRVTVPLSHDHPQRAVLETAGDRCPVRLSLHPEVEVDLAYDWVG